MGKQKPSDWRKRGVNLKDSAAQSQWYDDNIGKYEKQGVETPLPGQTNTSDAGGVEIIRDPKTQRIIGIR
jgi:hypothetical protein